MKTKEFRADVSIRSVVCGAGKATFAPKQTIAAAISVAKIGRFITLSPLVEVDF
jgi:hypothetical protein